MSGFHLTVREFGYIHSSSKNIGKERLNKTRFKELKTCLCKYNDEHAKQLFGIGDQKLQARGFVGTIETPGGTSVEVLPKIDLGQSAEKKSQPEKDEDTREIFLKMLAAYLARDKMIQIDDVHIETHKNLPLMDFLLILLHAEVTKLLRRGLARAYVTREDNLYRFKGKLDMNQHLRHNFAHKERFYVRYDEFTPDRPVNRVIRAAIEVGLMLAKNTATRNKMMQILPYFDGVRSITHTQAQDWREEDKRIHLQRNIRDYYTTPLKLARLILSRWHPAGWRAQQKLYSLLFQMHDVFECYVAEKLSGFAQDQNYNLKSQDQSHYLMKEKKSNGISFQMRPDMVMRPGSPKNSPDNRALLILDTKWKIINTKNKESNYGISQADLYQLYSYGMRYARAEKRPVSLALLYPENKNFQDTVHLREPFEEMKQQNADNLNRGLDLYIVPVDLSSALEAGPANKVLIKTEKELKTIIKQASQHPSPAGPNTITS